MATRRAACCVVLAVLIKRNLRVWWSRLVTAVRRARVNRDGQPANPGRSRYADLTVRRSHCRPPRTSWMHSEFQSPRHARDNAPLATGDPRHSSPWGRVKSRISYSKCGRADKPHQRAGQRGRRQSRPGHRPDDPGQPRRCPAWATGPPVAGMTLLRSTLFSVVPLSVLIAFALQTACAARHPGGARSGLGDARCERADREHPVVAGRRPGAAVRHAERGGQSGPARRSCRRWSAGIWSGTR